ncbi:MAG: type II toxin-antitoxin system RelE/ParE family toxin [Gammaproteobacteria bacterium]
MTREAVDEMVAGLVDAERGGVRTLVATNQGDRWFFVFGFAKNDKANVSEKELGALKLQAADLLALSAAQLDKAAADGILQEICDGNEGEKQDS